MTVTSDAIAAGIQAEADAIAEAMRVYQASADKEVRGDMIVSTDVLLERLNEDWAVLVRKLKERR